MIIIQTTIRQGVDYLLQTISQIKDVGDRQKVIVSDGPMLNRELVPKDWNIIELPKQGARATGWECFNIAHKSKVQDLILLQDDILLCKNGANIMHKIIIPDSCIAVSFYTPFWFTGIQPTELGNPRFITLEACGTAQALKFPYIALEYFCNIDPLTAPNIEPLHPHLFDDALFALARMSSLHLVAQLLPNPVQHIGLVSACGTKGMHHQPWHVPQNEEFLADIQCLPVVRI